jgi:hypothetical protein
MAETDVDPQEPAIRPIDEMILIVLADPQHAEIDDRSPAGRLDRGRVAVDQRTRSLAEVLDRAG